MRTKPAFSNGMSQKAAIDPPQQLRGLQCPRGVVRAAGPRPGRFDVAARVEQGVPLHCRLGASETRPREDREAQVDGGGVERVDGVVEIESEAVSSSSR